MTLMHQQHQTGPPTRQTHHSLCLSAGPISPKQTENKYPKENLNCRITELWKEDHCFPHPANFKTCSHEDSHLEEEEKHSFHDGCIFSTTEVSFLGREVTIIYLVGILCKVPCVSSHKSVSPPPDLV